MSAKISVYLVDDHPLMRKGLMLTIESSIEFTVCGQAESAEIALREIPVCKPDIAILDISLPGMNGIELAKHLLAIEPDLRILMVSRHDEELYAERALKAGAKGYVMKMEAGDVIFSALKTIHQGQIYVSDSIRNKMLMKLTGHGGDTGNPLDTLSDRELEIFELRGQGHSTREISERLHISVKTVESHRANIKEKLQLKNATELMRHAIRWLESNR